MTARGWANALLGTQRGTGRSVRILCDCQTSRPALNRVAWEADFDPTWEEVRWLSHTQLFHTQLFHTQLFLHATFSHTTLSHSYTTLSQLSHTHTTLSHTQLFHRQLFETIDPPPSPLSVPFQPLFLIIGRSRLVGPIVAVSVFFS